LQAAKAGGNPDMVVQTALQYSVGKAENQFSALALAWRETEQSHITQRNLWNRM
jgi:hypothetical protein